MIQPVKSGKENAMPKILLHSPRDGMRLELRSLEVAAEPGPDISGILN